MWWAEGRQKKEIAALAGVSRPTVDLLWLKRYEADGVAGLLDRPRGAGREQVPAEIRARVLAASRTSPPTETGVPQQGCHWHLVGLRDSLDPQAAADTAGAPTV